MLPSVAGREGMIGDIGTVLEHDVARGKLRVFVDGEYWQARFAGNDALQVGDKMKVVGMEGLTLIVEKV
jgi:membrane-bound serine protease (ClpP class)